LSSEEGVWVTIVGSNQGYLGRWLLRFERDVCYAVKPGKNIFAIKPKKLERTDALTLIAENSFWNYGKVLMRFDATVDADNIEQQLRRQVHVSKRRNKFSKPAGKVHYYSLAESVVRIRHASMVARGIPVRLDDFVLWISKLPFPFLNSIEQSLLFFHGMFGVF